MKQDEGGPTLARKRRTRRQFERALSSIDAEWGTAPNDFRRKAIVISLSVGGCLLRTKVDEPLSNKIIHLRFMLPAHHYESHWVTLRGEIAYYYRGAGGGFGMTFKDLTPQEIETLKMLVLYWREVNGAPQSEADLELIPPDEHLPNLQ